ncbi:MAG: TonB-dependent receptor [Acidobacteriales bacterium]|nr:TonB-dependent receptor [Terriglobales bacterium]
MTPKFAFVCKILFVCLLTILISLPAMSQGGNQGSIEGTVLDQSGAVVSEATVTATNTETGAKFSNTTTTDGFFRFPVLPVGRYDVSVERSGFARTTQKDVVLTVGGRLNLPITVKVASQSEAVEVTAEAPLVETTRSQVSTTVDSRSIQSLPVNGRNFIEFSLLTPGVNRDNTRPGDISFGGLRGTLNSLVVDGTDNNNTFFGQAAGRTGTGRAPYQFSQDAVQEFQVNTNGYSAELGRAGGAVINAITKSGTNAFHGSAFWFYRDQSLNAANPFTKLFNAFVTNPTQLRNPNPPYHYNQYGGSLGGYFIKDKLFFFANYDGQRNTQPNSVTFNPPAVLNQFETFAVNYLAPRANSWVRAQDQDDYLGKLDWIINSKHNANVRWNKQHFSGANFENSGATMSEEHTGAANVRTTNITTAVTSNLASNFINVARFTYFHDREPGQANSSLPELLISQTGASAFSFTAGRNFFSPRETTIDRYQYGDSVTYVRGRHTFKGGIDVIHDQIFNLFPGTSNGSYRLTLDQLGRSLCRSGLTPLPATITACGAPAGSFSQNFFGAGTAGPVTEPNLFDLGVYFQDDWKVNHNLTLNLGIRYDLDTYDQPSFQNPVALAAGFDTSRINKDQNNIAPRFGFAWTPFSNRWVWRGGYGIFFSRTPAISLSTAFSNNGVAVQNRSIPASSPLFPNYPNSACGPVDEAGSSCAPPAGLAAAAPPIIIVAQSDYQQPYVQQWNLTTEYELMKDLAVSVGYLGVKGTKLTRFRDVNLFAPVPTTITVAGQPALLFRYPGTTTPARPVTAFSRIEQIEAAGSSIYHGMVVQVTKRFSRNFQALASYTWSHGIDDNPDATAVVPGGSDDIKLNYSPLLPGLDRASGETDIRNRFVLSGVWDLNYAGGLPTVAKAILEGWQISGILTAQGGQPYTAHVSGNADINRDGITAQEQVPGVGRNTFRLPANYSLDPRITRKVRVREGMQLELFAEAFNLFNRFNYYSANFNQFSGTALTPLAVSATSFGMPREVIGAQPVQRVIQLGTKFVF